ncbi:MAG: sulfatase [Thermodesulfobacteriota bacterium]
MPPRALVVLLGLTAVAVVAWLTSSAPPDAPRPNVLLVSIDSLRADHLHAYGYPRETSPTIDALARDGALFGRAVAPSTWTLPSHMTLLTAMPPEQHGVASNERQLDPAAVTLAEVLRSAGYATAGFAAAPYVRAMYGFDQGFDLYDESIVKDGLFDSLRGATSPESTRLVSEYLERWDRDGRQKPFFVFLHLWDPHYDYNPPPPYDTMFDPHYAGTITGNDFLTNPKVRPDMDRRDLEHIVALYDGEIRYTDEHLGRLVDLLRRLGVLDDTVVVVTADHGEEFFEHGRKGHGEVLYDETMLVPLVIRFPRAVAPGRVLEEQVRLMDVAPTIIELAGVVPPEAFGTPTGTPHGATSLASFIAADGADELPALVAFGTTKMGKLTRSAVRRQHSKLIVQSPGPPHPEAYDLAADPGERVNLSREPDDEPLVQGLQEELSSWASLWSGGPRYAKVLEVPTSQAERLKALGYIR